VVAVLNFMVLSRHIDWRQENNDSS